MTSIRRRSGLTLVVAAMVVSLVLVACQTHNPGPAGSVGAPARVSDGPNIVLITTDDQAVVDLRWMPLTRRLLGAAGATFQDFLAPHPLCCPARAQILTGQYAQNNGVRSNHGEHGGYGAMRDPDHILPAWLREVGYHTSFVGKYINGYRYHDGIPAGWERWDATVRYGYHGYVQFDGQDLTRPAAYHTDYVAQRSAEEIRTLAQKDEPFFLWTSFYAPHGVCSPKQEIGCKTPPPVEPQFARAFRHVRAPFLDKPSFNEDDVSDKPRVVVRRGRVDEAEMQRLFLQRIRALQSVDLGVARIVAALQEAGALDDTVIAFTSDNGYLYGEHRHTGKTLAYEESVRVPLLVRGPGIEPGRVLPQTAAMIDLAPTFAELAGAEPSVPVDGRSLVELARDPHRVADRTLLVQAGIRGPDPKGLDWEYRGVRTGRYTFVYWFKTGFVELYDRRRDPYELRNVAHDPRYARIVEVLADRTRELGDCSGAACRGDFGPVPEPRRR